MESQLVTRDGRRLFIAWSNTTLSDDSGKVDFVISAGLDITDRKMIEDQLEEAKSQAEMYLDLMGHDITNMDQIAKGFLELALDRLDLDETGRELISKPLEALESSTALINNIKRLRYIKKIVSS